MDYQLANERGEKIQPRVEVEDNSQEVVQNTPETQEEVHTSESMGDEDQSLVESVPEKRSDVQKTVSEESGQARNFRELRERAERLEREKDLAYKFIQEMQSKSPKQSPVEEESNDFNLAPDDLAEGKHLTKVQREVKKLRDELNQYKQQSTQVTAEQKILNKYPDFKKVVSSENVEILKDLDPDLAASINSSNDLYATAVLAYNAIKNTGIYKSPVNYQNDIQRVKDNAAKPRTLTSLNPQQGDSPISKANAFANGLTDDLRRQLHKEMMDALKNR